MLRKTPLVVILGSTATGKTKLSIELAKRFSGEVISADSMQIYTGLDISTAKANKEERSQAVHHMLDVCDFTTKTFSIIDFRDKALPIIDQLIESNKLPIIVGGTTYYIESLLWKVLIGTESDENIEKTNSFNSLSQSEKDLLNEPIDDIQDDECEDLHKLLTKVDPVTAQRLHPKNIRKIRRALNVFFDSGKAMSEILNEQQLEDGGSYLGGPLRYEHIVMFWLKCDQEKLNARIDRRIDSMIAEGMLFELRKCYNILKADKIDATRGMMQTIGFKEFLPYLEKYSDENFDGEITEFILLHGGLSGQKKFIVKNRISDALKLLEECLDELRMATKRYSKKQLKWIRNRLVSNKGRLVPPIYELDSTNAETNWHQDVYVKAENVVQSYIDDIEPKWQPIKPSKHPMADLNMHVTHFCDVCNRRFVGDHEYNIHMNSQRHKKAAQGQRKRDKRQAIEKRSIVGQSFDNFCQFISRLKNRIISFFWR